MEDFVPEDSLDRSFLEDAAPQKEEKTGAPQPDSDSDGEAGAGNPMVAGFQDDVDLEDRPPGGALPPSGPVPSKNISLSSEEEAEEVARPPRPTALAPQQCPEPETKRFHAKASRPQGGPAPPPWPDSQGPRNLSDTGRPAEGSQGQARASSSESDPEGPIAAQMLSFVMDDPDFESGESDTQRRVAEFPVREDPSDVTDEDAGPAPPPPPPPPPIPAFRVKSGADLFGLGPEEPGAKESSDEGKAGKAPSKEKRKKKKKSKEEEDKAGKKSRAKGKKEEGREERRRKKKERKAVDELEAFLGGGAPSSRHPGGGDYEEL